MENFNDINTYMKGIQSLLDSNKWCLNGCDLTQIIKYRPIPKKQNEEEID